MRRVVAFLLVSAPASLIAPACSSFTDAPTDAPDGGTTGADASSGGDGAAAEAGSSTACPATALFCERFDTGLAAGWKLVGAPKLIDDPAGGKFARFEVANEKAYLARDVPMPADDNQIVVTFRVAIQANGAFVKGPNIVTADGSGSNGLAFKESQAVCDVEENGQDRNIGPLADGWQTVTLQYTIRTAQMFLKCDSDAPVASEQTATTATKPANPFELRFGISYFEGPTILDLDDLVITSRKAL